MRKDISLTIRMDNPCKEDWNCMEPTENAKFCNQCQKEVIDFVDFTDEQIRNYFLKNPKPVCGRIKNRNKGFQFEYFAAKPANNIKFSPVAATLLTLSTLTSNASQELKISEDSFQTQPSNKNISPIVSDSIIVSGTVKNDAGAPIENAEIIFAEIKVLTDKNGDFKLNISPDHNKPSLLQFSYGDLIRQVRNYNPVMGSTTFNIVLYERRYSEHVTMGIMVPEYSLPDSLSSLSLNFTDKLNLKTKLFLQNLAVLMRSHPELGITMASSYKVNKTKATKFIGLVKNYLVLNEGITEDRILLKKSALEKNNKSEILIEFSSNIE